MSSGMYIYTMAEIYEIAKNYAGGKRVEYVEIGICEGGDTLLLICYIMGNGKKGIGAYRLSYDKLEGCTEKKNEGVRE